MPLINFQTDLKSLSFGRDQRGGGDSKQPYITKDIPEGLSNDDLPVRSGPDFIIRGGLKSVSNAVDDVARLGKYMIDGASGIKFIAKQNLLSRTSVKTPASFGIGYGGASPFVFSTNESGKVIKGGGNVNQGIYTPISTLAAALGNGLGVHPNLFGVDPFSPISGVVEGSLFDGDLGIKTYTAATAKFNDENDGGKNNRLVIFNDRAIEVGTKNDQNIYAYSGGPGSILGIGKTNIKFADQRTGAANRKGSGILNKAYQVGYQSYTANVTDDLTNLGLTPLSVNSLNATDKFLTSLGLNQTSALGKIMLQNSVGGDYISTVGQPSYAGSGGIRLIQTNNNAVFGYEFDTGDELLTDPKVLYDGDLVGFGGFRSLTYNLNQLQDKENVSKGEPILYPQDFRKELYTGPNEGSAAAKNADGTGGNQRSTILSLSPDYRTKNIDRRLNMGQPGKSNTGTEQGFIKNVWDYGIAANELEALDKITAQPMYTSAGPNTELAINDLVKFRIAAIDNDAANRQAVYMHFRAHLDSFSDSYNASWNEVQYVGRGDTLYNYGGFGRSISLGFTCFAQSKAELIPMHKKLNYLASTLSPDYTQAGFMRGNLVRLTVGGYLYEQPGFITQLTYDVPEEAPWEIAINAEGGVDSSVKELPHMVKVSGFSFTPIHTFLPQKPNNANNPNSRYIAMANAPNSRGNYADVYREYNATGDGDNNNQNDILGE
tara:strand:- start:2103 stop:4250 length:2148 start_codon:yes stop_codon:yes gene_type:complete